MNEPIKEPAKIRKMIAVSDLLIPNSEAALLGESRLHPNSARSSPAREKSTIADMVINAVSFHNACEPKPKMKRKTYLSA
jgi:hypothetical protein